MLEQVQIGSHAFTYDYVYGCTGLPSSAIYDDCVGPLIDALFYGYNATVLAYGQVRLLYFVLFILFCSRSGFQHNEATVVFIFVDWFWKNIHHGNQLYW